MLITPYVTANIFWVYSLFLDLNDLSLLELFGPVFLYLFQLCVYGPFKCIGSGLMNVSSRSRRH